MRKLILIVLSASSSYFLSACNITERQHNDVLIFGTSTKVAIDVSAPVQNAGIPEFTIGYKRQEAVWMPLRPSDSTASGGAAASQQVVSRLNACMQTVQGGLTNEQKAKVCLATVLPGDKYVSISSGIQNSKGGGDVEIDTYSVFASFGAKGSLSFSSANGGLAQFFATGVAAQRLGANPTVGVALSANAGEAVAEIAKSEAIERTELSEEQKTRMAQRETDVEVAKGCVVDAGGTVPGGITNANAQTIFGFYAQENRLIAELKRDDAARKAILEDCKGS